MLKEILDFALFGLPGWLAILLELADKIPKRKDKRTDDEQKK